LWSDDLQRTVPQWNGVDDKNESLTILNTVILLSSCTVKAISRAGGLARPDGRKFLLRSFVSDRLLLGGSEAE